MTADLLNLAAVFLLAILQLLDWYTTRTIMDVFLGVKAVFVAVVGGLTTLLTPWAIIAMVAIYVWVIAHNWQSMP